jgi:hypothetical protein
VRSYRTFSPSPPSREKRDEGCLFSVALSVEKSFNFPPACIPGQNRSYAASRPLVFGLSSSGSRRKRFSALPKPKLKYQVALKSQASNLQ